MKEVTYHLRRSSDLVVRMGDGTQDSWQKTQTAVDRLWMYTGEMFEADEVDDVMVAQRVSGDMADLRTEWRKHVGEVLADATLTMPSAQAWMQKGGKQGRHSENMGYILAEMQFLQRAYPEARW